MMDHNCAKWLRQTTLHPHSHLDCRAAATTAQRTGVDAIAAAWAAANDVKLIAFKLNMAHGRAAGFKRNIAFVKLAPVQAIICKGSHIQVDLAEKMRTAGIAVTIIRPATDQSQGPRETKAA